jgi:hypothetical protein
MGINTDAWLYASTDLDEVVEAIRNLTDADEVKLGIGYDSEAPSIRRGDEYVQGASYFTLNIAREAGFGDGETHHSGSVSFGDTHRDFKNNDKLLIDGGIRLHGGNASAFWVSLLDALVHVFGGVVDYNDCDSTYADTVVTRKMPGRYHGNDPEFSRVRALIQGLTTVTDEAGLARYDGVHGIYDRKGEYVS